MNRTRTLRACMAAIALLAAACSRAPAPSLEAPVATPTTTTTPASVVVATDDQPPCTDQTRTDEHDKRPRCGGLRAASRAPRAYRVVGGSGDPVDQVVCDIADAFVLDGKMFGVQFSGGADGTYKFVRTPNIPGLHWQAGGRYHIEFPDGEGMPGTMTTEGGGTTTAGALSRETAGAEHFTLTPAADCAVAATTGIGPGTSR